MTKGHESEQGEKSEPLEEPSFIEGDEIFLLPQYVTRPRLEALADDAAAAAERATAAIDDVLTFVAASNARINATAASR